MYAEYKDVPVHRVQACTWSTGILHRVRECITLYAEYTSFLCAMTTSHLNQMMIYMTLHHYNHIHMQSHYCLYSSCRTNYPGRVGKTFTPQYLPTSLEVVLTRRLSISMWWWFLKLLGSSRVVSIVFQYIKIYWNRVDDEWIDD